MEHIYPFITGIYSEFQIFLRNFIKIIETIFIKDPCKKCIVRSCCSEKCELKKYISSYYGDINGNLGYQKICAISILVGVLLLIIIIIKLFSSM